MKNQEVPQLGWNETMEDMSFDDQVEVATEIIDILNEWEDTKKMEFPKALKDAIVEIAKYSFKSGYEKGWNNAYEGAMAYVDYLENGEE